jgi:hypothetical protein
MIVGKYPRTQVQHIDLKRSLEQGVIAFRLHLSSKEGIEWRVLTGELAELSGVRELTLLLSLFPSILPGWSGI